MNGESFLTTSEGVTFSFMLGFGMAVSYVPQALFSVLANSEGCYVPEWLAVE